MLTANCTIASRLIPSRTAVVMVGLVSQARLSKQNGSIDFILSASVYDLCCHCARDVIMQIHAEGSDDVKQDYDIAYKYFKAAANMVGGV